MLQLYKQKESQFMLNMDPEEVTALYHLTAVFNGENRGQIVYIIQHMIEEILNIFSRNK